MVVLGSLREFEQVTPGAGLVDKDAGATPNGPTPNSGGHQDAPDAILGNGQIRDVFQNERGITVHIDRARDALLTTFTHKTLSGSFNVRSRHLAELLAANGRDAGAPIDYDECLACQ